MNETEEAAQKFIANFKSEFSSLPIEDISFPRGCNGINKWANPTTIYSKGTPIHVRGALLYNFYNKKNKLTHKYPLIQDGEKVKFVYMKTPNKINENVLSYLQTFPKEFGLNNHVDYDLQFNKSFLEPVKVILDTIGWKHEKVASLEFLFGWTTKYVVSYQKAFGIPDKRELKSFEEESEAKWFERAMKRSNFITKL